jgi:serine/threonine protein kinase
VSNWVGKALGKVQIESLLGRGGVAEVYLGTHTTLDRKVAVKILRNLHEGNSDILARFQREARVIAKFRHPNIVQVHDFDTVENDPYLVMEYIEGPSLSQYLRVLHQNYERLPQRQVIHIIDALASALQYAHGQGVIHRDVKPGNILLTSPSGPVEVGKPLPEDFEPVLTDFGLVRFLDASRETTTGHIAGTPAYMSPEQARGEAADGRTDVYSLGIVLYEMLAGHVPFDGDTTVSILLKQVNQMPPPVPGVSPLIDDVLKRALAKEPEKRFQTPMDFARALHTVMDIRSDHTTIQASPLPRMFSGARPSWSRIAILAGVAVALAGFLFLRNRPASRPANATPTSLLAPSVDASSTAPVASPTVTSAVLPGLDSGPAGILRFENNAALADQASLLVRSMPAPPAGSRYELWLTSANDRLSLGTFVPDPTGRGELHFTEPEGANLLARYDQLEITIEPESDTDPQASDLIAYSFALPDESLLHLRYLLSAFPGTPTKLGLVPGMLADLTHLHALVMEMQADYEDGDTVTALANAEDALNLLVGSNSPDFQDWNGDGHVLARNASYGLMVNGNNFGYIRSVYAEADYIVNAPGSTQYMVENGQIVKACTQNLEAWAAQLRERLITILTATSTAEVAKAIEDAVAVADQMLSGIDQDGDGTVEPIPGECGAGGLREYAYYMADMPILPVSISYQLTVVANPAYVPPTRVREGSENGEDVPVNPVVNTPRPDNTRRPPRPTKTDKPRDNSGNSANPNNPNRP